jgi:DNA-binding response OmpR family regulator
MFCRLFEDFVNQQEVDIRLDRSSGKVWVEGEEVSPALTAAEFTLLSYLYERRGEICSKSELEALYPDEPQNVDTLMDQLRKKIESDPRRPKYILTVRGQGFKLARATPGQS